MTAADWDNVATCAVRRGSYYGYVCAMEMAHTTPLRDKLRHAISAWISISSISVETT